VNGTTFNLSDDQVRAVDAIRGFCRADGRDTDFVLGGLAGTGKTTVSGKLSRGEVDGVSVAAVVAPTGKAASRLRERGVENACTLHALLYNFGGQSENLETGERELKFYDKDVVHVGHGIIICDEASMVGSREIDALRGVGRRVLWVGDHGQLPPIRGDLGLMLRPDAVLEKIHRQGEGSDIVRFSHALRSGEAPQFVANDLKLDASKEVRIVGAGGGSSAMAAVLEAIEQMPAAQVIVPYNALRRRMNAALRKRALAQLGSTPDPWVQQGDLLICTRTEYAIGVYNGEQVRVHSASDWKDENGRVTAHVIGAVGDRPISMMVQMVDEDSSMEERERGAPVLVDYGYAITCHKAQGSEWDDVIVVDPGRTSQFDLPRWRYTAATRARRRLVYAA